MNEQSIEQEIQAKGLTAPRVTPEDARRRMLRGNLGNRQADEHRLKISAALTGRRLSASHRTALSAAAKRRSKPLEGYLLKQSLFEAEQL